MRYLVTLAAAMLGGGLALNAPAAPTPETLDYNRDVRPILSAKCFACHGADERQRQAGLRLDGPNGAIVPGDVVNSELTKRILASDSRADAARALPEAARRRREAHAAALDRRRRGLPDALGVRPGETLSRAEAIDAFVSTTTRSRGVDALPARRPRDVDPKGYLRPDRPAADARRGRCVRDRQEPKRLRESRG